MKNVSLEQLLSKWWIFEEPISREEIDLLDWDELLALLGIMCEDAGKKNIIVGDVDMKTYHNPAIAFSELLILLK